MKIRELISEIFCPTDIKCIMCDNEIFDDSRYCICDKCKLPVNDNFCISCGRGIPDMSDFCDYCKERPCHFTKARAPLLYTDDLHRVVYKIKYGGAKYLAEIFARIMYDSFVTYDWKIEEVTFVPMHKKRFKERGYNQAELIGKAFCEKAGFSLVDYLDRIKYTDNLAKMNREQREEAIKGSIVIKNGKKCDGIVLLIDDILTTASTSNECARILKQAGAKAVYLLTLATSKMKPVLY